ncbi:MAG: sigma-54-dependent Fis family transcriptional regulator [Polyangiaceae bacterium]|nr:sigma-54-dependent Fis family transcriptional regulator [Polyangiaceae bacterium]
MPEARILFVEDDAAGRELGSYNLRKAGYDVDAVASGEEALARFSPDVHALVITDVRMPGISGLDVLRSVKVKAPDVPVLVITAYGSVETAVEAMKQGAADFVGKPFNRDHLLLSVERALEGRQLRDEVRRLRRNAAGVERPLVAASEAMRRVLEIADRVAASDATVLITGETGTGKELVARRVHAHSGRADGPFVAINCAAVPGDLLESELFGHEKGAFTGATRAREGRFRQAEGGTLFLDEIGEMPPSLQGKLLRVLQERVVDVVGGDRPVVVDVRLLAATNRDLAHMAREGSFREDLLYRINVLEVRVPPLRERPEEIAPLARHFVERFARGRELSLPEDVIAELRARPWPGNVRQLENACERLVILCDGDTLQLDDLPPRDDQPEAGTAMEWPDLPPDGLGLVDLEKRVIERVLALKHGNVSQAAQYLRVPRHVLAYRMVKYGISRD